MTRYTRAAAVILVLALSGQAQAVEVTTEQSEGSSVHGERSYSGKTSLEGKDSTGRKRNKSKTTGSDQTTSDSKKKSATATKGHSLDTTASLMILFEAPLDELAPLAPILPGDVGLSSELAPGYIDTIKASMLKEAAASNAGVGSVGGDQEALTSYALAVADRGAVAAQAARNLADDIASLQAGKKKPGKAGEFEVTALGAEDLERLARGAVQRVFVDGKPVIRDQDIQRRLKSIKDRIERGGSAWRFAGSPEKLTPGGGIELALAVAPTLAASGAKWYSPADSSFAGYSVSYKVSSSWSLADSLEALKSSSKYSKLAYEISAYAEQLEAKGRTQEATALRKQTVESAESNKAILNPFKFIQLPGGGE